MNQILYGQHFNFLLISTNRIYDTFSTHIYKQHTKCNFTWESFDENLKLQGLRRMVANLLVVWSLLREDVNEMLAIFF